MGVLGVAVLLIAGGWLRIGFSTLLHMRTGKIDAELAGAVVAEHLGIDGLVRGDMPDIEQDREIRMAEAVRRLGKPVSELADSNATPFYKNFLSVEVVGDELLIRCWGVTGDTLVPTLEDRFSVSLAPDA